MKKRVIILGAAGRDFHNFNTYLRDNSDYEVVAFTATQIPGIENRGYPKELSGKLYPKGIPIYLESELPDLIKKYKVDEVILAYSDLLYEDVMHKASIALSAGADFKLMGLNLTTLKSIKPVIAIVATRTGAGKSTVTRKVCDILKSLNKKVVVVRHPMPYGVLNNQVVERFRTEEDLDKYKCTIEEREEYTQHIEKGFIVYAGVDYEKILRQAEKEADIILWDGGNNDFSFYKADLTIIVADPYRAGHELISYPGEVNARVADIVVINKVHKDNLKEVEIVENNIRKVNLKAKIVRAESIFKVDKPELINGKSVLVLEDGPTVTHGGLPYAVGYVAAKQFKAKEIVDPRPYLTGSLKQVFEKFKHMANILPTIGYSKEQIKDIEETANKVKCDSIVAGTTADVTRIMKLNKPVVRVHFELKEQQPILEQEIKKLLKL